MSDLIPGVTPARPAPTAVTRPVPVEPGRKPAVEIHGEIISNIRRAFPTLNDEAADQLARFTLDYARICVSNVLTEAADAVTHITHPDPVTNAIGEDVRHAAQRTVVAHRDRFNRLNYLPPAESRPITEESTRP